MAKTVKDDEGEDFYDIELPVFPGEIKMARPDIMLVQYLVKAFFSNARIHNGKDLAKWNDIHRRATARGGRFDDGKYGPLTREAVYLYETISHAPYKDGIVRPAGVHINDTQRMKIKHLNQMLDINRFGRSRIQFARDVGVNPLLLALLHPGS